MHVCTYTHSVVDICLVTYFSQCCDQTPDKKQFKELGWGVEGVSQLKGSIHPCREIKAVELRAAGHIASVDM